MASKKVVPISRQRTVMLDGQPYVLRRDFRSMVVLEELTGKSVQTINQSFTAKAFTTTAQLLYALSATHRKDNGQEDMSFDDFISLLPDMSELNRLNEVMDALFRDVASGDSGNAPGPSAEAVAAD